MCAFLDAWMKNVTEDSTALSYTFKVTVSVTDLL